MKIEEKLIKILGQDRIKLNEPLSLHTTFRIGGPADHYYETNTVEDLVKAVKVAEASGNPPFILGGGSNVLVSDKGFRGLVIRNKSKNIKILGYKGQVKSSAFAPAIGGASADKQNLEIRSVLVEAESGVPFNQLIRFTIEEGLAGLEDFLGLPGTIGGAVACNAHWKEKKVQDFVVSKKTWGSEVLLSVVFRLEKGDKEILWEKAREAVNYRLKTQPKGASAGCIFKNIKASEAARIGVPNFTTSAGFLIEAAGLKGTKVGSVQFSPLHANFIINLGGGKAEDVLKLIDLGKKRVREKFGVNLEEEIIKVGEF